jgi:hypothetical protein
MRAQMIRIITGPMRIVSHHHPSGSSARTPGAAALLGGLVLLLAGCGSHLVKVDSSVLRVRIDEYSITPDNVEMHAGRIKIVAVNTGILTHDVKVEAVKPNAAGNAVVLGGTTVMQPGQKLTSEKLTLAPGKYKLIDTIANHADLGDYGTLTIK